MKTYILEKRQIVEQPLGEVFAFFEQPVNLAAITPPWLGFRMVTPPPITMKQGAVFEYSVKVNGIRLRWKSLISSYTPPFRFVDEQIKGPYAFWHHTHEFSSVNGGTLVTDVVRYRMPFGIVGNLIREWVVADQLEKIFNHRNGAIQQLLEKKMVRYDVTPNRHPSDEGSRS